MAWDVVCVYSIIFSFLVLACTYSTILLRVSTFIFPLTKKNCAESILYNNSIKPFIFNCNVHNFPQNKFLTRFLSSNSVTAINQISINNFE